MILKFGARKSIAISFIMALMVFCGSITIFGGNDEDEISIVVVAHKDINEAKLTKSEIKNIFLGKKTSWEDGSKITIITLKRGKAHETFLKSNVGKTAKQYKTYWKKQVFAGKGKEPKSYSKESSLVEYVKKTKGTIGYISSSTEHAGLKVIEVE